MRARRGCQATQPQTSFRNRPLIPPAAQRAACPQLTAPRSPTKHWLGVRPRAVLVPPTLVMDPCDGEWGDLGSLPFGASETCDELSLFFKSVCSILLPPCSYRCCSRGCFPANRVQISVSCLVPLTPSLFYFSFHGCTNMLCPP